MPVSVLLCEGQSGSPDVRVLNRVLSGLCEVRPFGGKYGMGDRILARREAMKADVVFGILDGDFRTWSGVTEKPQVWNSSDNVWLGWRWERKEIENYLIDPAVVAKAAPEIPSDEYRKLLESARDAIQYYEAARTALSLRRPRFQPLTNELPGDPTRHTRDSCLQGVRGVVEQWNAAMHVEANTVEDVYRATVPECCSGGRRHADYLSAFAGKDLLLALRDGLTPWGFRSAGHFIERVLDAIRTSADDVASWLPEWTALREAVAAVT